ncbi:hypothetical protein G5714_019247 [Onychostoma macrolepis]|uniref:Uncharacterized protein n=1 Tax=Onychostoma macrolepis TaxID=369639 RepID=A0A7J6BWI4_9TELE|nr:hypothetical protein G5714_019247 [Onychostoma macrolepis]
MRNCDPAKHQVKLDQGIDKTVSFLKSRTHTIGGTGEISFSGKVPLLASLGGKLGLKYDYSRLKSKTTSTVEKSLHSLKSRTHTIGGTGEISFSGKVPLLASLGGKLGLKYDYSRLKSKTTSTVEKSLHSVSMEVQVPANHICSIDVKSNTFTAEVPYTGQLTRIYNNNEIRRTLINDIYSHQEVAEIQALVNPCTPLSDGKKC